MQKAAPVETSESEAETDHTRPTVRGVMPLTQSKMHAVPAPAAEPPALPRRSALAIEILSFVLIAFLVVSALLFNLTAPRPVVSGSPAVSVPLPPKRAEPAATAFARAPVSEETPAAQPEPVAAASLPDVQPQAGLPPSALQAENEAVPQPERSGETATLLPTVVEDAAPAVASAPVPLPAPAPVEETASLPLPAGEAEALIRRGNELLATGDVVAARAAYERAAVGGNRAAAIGVAKTYDPIFLAQTGVRGLRGDPARAALWYGKAAAAGDYDAQQRLKRLRAQYPQ